MKAPACTAASVARSESGSSSAIATSLTTVGSNFRAEDRNHAKTLQRVYPRPTRRALAHKLSFNQHLTGLFVDLAVKHPICLQMFAE